jgi:predicted transposase YbfD/YdcC
MVQLQYSEMLERFKDVPDPRTRPNRIYPWQFLWGLISAAMASACQTPADIARWIREHRDELLAVLPPTLIRLPCESTIRRTLASVNASKLDAALTLLPTPTPPPPLQETPADPPTRLMGQAIDGKNVRGVGRDGHPCQLVSLVEHASATVLAQEQVARKRDERSAVPLLLAQRDLRGIVITLDALHTLKPTARLILAQNGDYLMVVKKNQATLYEFLDLLFRLPAHPCDHEVWDQQGPMSEKGHGRLETRTLICGNAHIEDVDWPGVAQVIRRECERIELKSGKVTREVSYALTSLAPSRAGAAMLEALWRGHWTIENRLHYVRDVSFGEDRGHAAAGATAHVLASVRNALLYLFRQAGWCLVPDAVAHYGASVRRALSLVGLNVST